MAAVHERIIVLEHSVVVGCRQYGWVRVITPEVGTPVGDRSLTMPGFGRVVLTDADGHVPLVLRAAVLGVVLSTAVGVLGVPPVGLHLPTHELGIMMPTCGATRAVAHAAVGDLAAAWRFNPLGPVLVLGAWGYLGREVVGRTTGRWCNVRLSLGLPARLLLAGAVVALAVNQQLHASLLA